MNVSELNLRGHARSASNAALAAIRKAHIVSDPLLELREWALRLGATRIIDPIDIHLVASGQVDLDSLVRGRFDLDDLRDALESDTDPESP